MSSICFFAAYLGNNPIPSYTRIYLTELKKHFDRVLFLCSETLTGEDLAFLAECDVDHGICDNRGYDFGKWRSAMVDSDLSGYDEVALVNDSCILFRPLDKFWTWSAANSSEVQGMTRSMHGGDHIQSYFIVLKDTAIPLSVDFLRSTSVVEKHADVIRYFEIGLSQHLISRGMRLSAFVHNDGYQGEFSPYYQCIESHLKQGLPLIKKRLLLSEFRAPELRTLARMDMNLQPQHYIDLMEREASEFLMDLRAVIRTYGQPMGFLDRIRYQTKRFYFRLGRTVKKLIRPSREA